MGKSFSTGGLHFLMNKLLGSHAMSEWKWTVFHILDTHIKTTHSFLNQITLAVRERERGREREGRGEVGWERFSSKAVKLGKRYISMTSVEKTLVALLETQFLHKWLKLNWTHLLESMCFLNNHVGMAFNCFLWFPGCLSSMKMLTRTVQGWPVVSKYGLPNTRLRSAGYVKDAAIFMASRLRQNQYSVNYIAI